MTGPFYCQLEEVRKMTKPKVSKEFQPCPKPMLSHQRPQEITPSEKAYAQKRTKSK